MNTVGSLLAELDRVSKSRGYIARIEILDLGKAMLKARLYLDQELFVQVYRNDRFNTTNFVLIQAGRRIFARDELGGAWHRHPVADPEFHNASAENRRPVTLEEFMDEVEQVIDELGL
jgi:hypothetical protein